MKLMLTNRERAKSIRILIGMQFPMRFIKRACPDIGILSSGNDVTQKDHCERGEKRAQARACACVYKKQKIRLLTMVFRFISLRSHLPYASSLSLFLSLARSPPFLPHSPSGTKIKLRLPKIDRGTFNCFSRGTERRTWSGDDSRASVSRELVKDEKRS